MDPPAEATIRVVSLTSLGLSRRVVSDLIHLQQDPRAAYASLASGPPAADADEVTPERATATITAAAAAAPTEPVEWHISNRYYTAVVYFTFGREAQDEPGRLGVEPAPPGCQVVMVVVARADMGSLASVLPSLRAAELDVAIVVGVSEAPDGPAPGSEDAGAAATGRDSDRNSDGDSPWDEICLEHGFEFIDASSLSRAGAALQSRMWPAMRMTGDHSTPLPVPELVGSPPTAQKADFARMDDDDDDDDGTEDDSEAPLEGPGFSVWSELDDEADPPSSAPWHPPAAELGSSFPCLPAAPDAPCRHAPHDFDDDFSPFVSASASGAGEARPPAPPRPEVCAASPTDSEIRLTEALLFGSARSGERQAPQRPGRAPVAAAAAWEGSLGSGAGDDWDLERILAKLQGLKAEAEGLDAAERRRLAERVALACERHLGL